MTLLSLLLVTLLGMVDGATRLWQQSENRVDSYREARAALGVISRDFRNAITAASNNDNFQLNSPTAFGLLPASALTDTNISAGIFFLSALPLKAQGGSNKSDICQVAYFVAFDRTSSSSNRALNLYRFLKSSDESFQAITNNPGVPPFTNSLTTTDAEVELLARNICSFTIQASTLTNNTLTNFSVSAGTPLPDIVEISIAAINKETAKKLDDDVSYWTNTSGPPIQPVIQTFTTRVLITRP